MPRVATKDPACCKLRLGPKKLRLVATETLIESGRGEGRDGAQSGAWLLSTNPSLSCLPQALEPLNMSSIKTFMW